MYINKFGSAYELVKINYYYLKLVVLFILFVLFISFILFTFFHSIVKLLSYSNGDCIILAYYTWEQRSTYGYWCIPACVYVRLRGPNSERNAYNGNQSSTSVRNPLVSHCLALSSIVWHSPPLSASFGCGPCGPRIIGAPQLYCPLYCALEAQFRQPNYGTLLIWRPSVLLQLFGYCW